MRTPKQYWLQLSSHLKNVFQLRGDYPQEPGEPICSIVEPRNSIRTLAEELQHLRGNYETAKIDNNRLVDTLDTFRLATEATRTKEQDRFAALEQRLEELLSMHNQSHNQITEMETALNETGARVDELARTIESYRSETTALLMTLGSQIVELADKGRLYLQMGQETLAGLQSQGRRLSWMTIVAAMVIVLAILSGVIIVRDVQKNAQLLVRLDSDMKQLIVSMGLHSGSKHSHLSQGLFSTDVAMTKVTTAQDARTRDGVGVKGESQGFVVEADSVMRNSDTTEPLSGDVTVAVQGMSQRRPMPSSIQEKTTFTEEDVSLGYMNTGGELHYKIVAPGTGRSPGITDSVIVNYLGVSPNGKVIDDTYSTGQPVTFPLSKLPLAMQEVLLKMEEGAEWEVYVQEEQRDSGSLTRRRAQESGPALYLIELVEVIRETKPAITSLVE